MEKFKRTFGFILNHPIGKKHIFKVFFNLILWQIQTAFNPYRLRVKNFIEPVKFYARKNLTGITGNIYTGLHEFNDMGFLLHFLRPEDTFFDVGANVGAYTLLASGVCKAKTIAIEPVTSTFDILSANIALNKIQDKVKLVNAGAGSAAATIAFTTNEDTTNHVIAANETKVDGVINVPVVSIDSFLIDNILPSLIKIDAEGYETEIIKGMSATLMASSLKAIIIELNGSGQRYGFNEQDIHNLLLSNGFTPYLYSPFTRTLSAIDSFGNYNTIYCREFDFVNNRLKTATAVKIMGEFI